MSPPFNKKEFEKRLKARLEESRLAFEGENADRLTGLLGLSRAEIDAITPDITDLQKYDELIVVVKEATRINLAQAALKSQIMKLGSVAVQIAKKVPSLAAILA